MNFLASNTSTKIVAGALVGALALGALAPVAEAGHKGKKKYRRHEWTQSGFHHGGGYVVHRGFAHPTRYYRSRSDAGPVIAGIIGGIAIGALLTSSSRPVYAEPYHYDDVYYVDPYCDRRYASLSVYLGHSRDYRHPRLVRVYARDGGHCLRTIRYADGGWCDVGPGYGGYSNAYYEDVETSYERRVVRRGGDYDEDDGYGY